MYTVGRMRLSFRHQARLDWYGILRPLTFLLPLPDTSESKCYFPTHLNK